MMMRLKAGHQAREAATEGAALVVHVRCQRRIQRDPVTVVVDHAQAHGPRHRDGFENGAFERQGIVDHVQVCRHAYAERKRRTMTAGPKRTNLNAMNAAENEHAGLRGRGLVLTRPAGEEGFDRAWRRVGLALDRVGFTVEDRDRVQGLYYVRYVDPDADVNGKKDDGFFSKLAFWRSDDTKDTRPASDIQYRVQVKGGART